MTWIAKRPCTIVRDGKKVTIPPGDPVPEAVNFPNPSAWCVYSEVDEKVKKNIRGKILSIDFDTISIVELKKLAKNSQDASKDYSTNLKTADREELISIVKAYAGLPSEKEVLEEGSEVFDEESLSKMKAKQLLKIAQSIIEEKALEVEIPPKAKKEELISVILQAQSSEKETPVE